MSTKISNDAVGNQTRSLQACSEVPQRTAAPCVPMRYGCRTEIARRRLEACVCVCVCDSALKEAVVA